MRKIALVLALLWSSTAVAQVNYFGTNLSGGMMSYDNSSLVFADLFKTSGVFNGYRGVAPVPYETPEGWPTRVDATTGETMTQLALGGFLPAGEYKLTAKGTGWGYMDTLYAQRPGNGWVRFEFKGDGICRHEDGTPIKFTWAGGRPYQYQINFRIFASKDGDPLREIHLWLPGHEGKTFYDGFLETLKPFTFLRFMDWMATNGSPLKEWSDLDKFKLKRTYASKPRVEDDIIIELCNTLKKDCWICIPALASPDFIQKMANYYESKLDKSLTIYIEYSNEVWNFGMPQWTQHTTLYNARTPAETTAIADRGMWGYIAMRDGIATNLFKATLPPTRKAWRVLARQHGYYETLKVAQRQYDSDKKVYDMVSCGGYFMCKADTGALATQFQSTDPAVKAAALTAVFDGVNKSQDEFATYLLEWKKMADAVKKPLVVYEGGQHLTNFLSDPETALFMTANGDPRMYDAIKRWMSKMPPGIGFSIYNDAGAWAKWGSWGFRQYTLEPLTTAHKMRALLEAIPNPQVVPTPPLPPPPPPPTDNLNLKEQTLVNMLKDLGLIGFLKREADGSYSATIGRDGADGLLKVKMLVQPQ